MEEQKVKMVRGCVPLVLDPSEDLKNSKKSLVSDVAAETSHLGGDPQQPAFEVLPPTTRIGFKNYKLKNPSWAVTSPQGCLEWNNPKARGLAYAEIVGGGALLASPFVSSVAKAPGWYKIPSFIVVGLVYSVGSLFGYAVAAHKHTWCAGQEPPGPIAIYKSLYSDVSSWF